MKIVLGLITCVLISSNLYGQEASKEGSHCEKKDKDGKVTDVAATSKDECKKAGGKWSKSHSDDHGKHGEEKGGESHDHKH